MSAASKPLTSLLIKPAGPDCNLACTYCFYSDKNRLFPEGSHRMSEEVLALLIKQVMSQSAGEISFGWQGGEPTLMGLEFFEKAVALEEKYHRGQLIGNGLQTNGLLLDEKWARFLRRNRFLVGLSLDGPEHVHDRYRRSRGGEGTWRRAADKAKMLLDAGVEVNALVVANDYSVRYPDEIYEFHKELGLPHMQFIPCLEFPDGKPAPYNVPPQLFGAFLCRIFDRWTADFDAGRPRTFIRFFDDLFYHYVGLPPPECALLPECGTYVLVEHDGSVYSCDFFVEPEWKLGTILEEALIDLLNSSRQQAFGRQKAQLVPGCRSCRWRKYCHGGCLKERGRPRGPALNLLCAGYKMFFEHANRFLTDLARKWKAEQGGEENLPRLRSR